MKIIRQLIINFILRKYEYSYLRRWLYSKILTSEEKEFYASLVNVLEKRIGAPKNKILKKVLKKVYCGSLNKIAVCCAVSLMHRNANTTHRIIMDDMLDGGCVHLRDLFPFNRSLSFFTFLRLSLIYLLALIIHNQKVKYWICSKLMTLEENGEMFCIITRVRWKTRSNSVKA